jgi:uncharacterized membrane protein
MTANEALPYAGILAICAMSVATIAMRLGGFWMMGHLPITPRVRKMLEALPGAVLVALVLPVVVKAGLSAYLTVGAVIAFMMFRRNEFIAVALGIAVVTASRAYGL